ncbi:zinc finger protein 777-like isoform X1 [Sphaerodactylus townsendi]|uniref:Uncharacterized protein n=1 Tax=Sphaerodactylus townsendi TaxID=933632 RepID=A0ACB8FWF5_9SAUR|nr:zinc finger protein 777-like isoform X1 [Sphaerodactylus townsendi]
MHFRGEGDSAERLTLEEPNAAFPVDKEPTTKTEPEKEPGSFEPWMLIGMSGENNFRGSAAAGETSLGSKGRPGSPTGELRGFSPSTEEQRQKPAEVRLYACPDCGKHFRFQIGLLNHQRSHVSHPAQRHCLPLAQGNKSPPAHGPRSPQGQGKVPHGPGEEKGWACPWCQQRFRLQVNLLIHQSSHRRPAAELGSQERLACGFCPRRFGRSDHLLRHQMSHTGDRPHKCPACDKSFVDKSKLTDHYRTHTGERPFRCAACGKSFMRRHHLLKHQRTHTRERPHQCPGCLKGFMQKHHLQKHMRTQPGGKPYRCSWCPKAFSCRQLLQQHSCASAPGEPGPAAPPTGGQDQRWGTGSAC